MLPLKHLLEGQKRVESKQEPKPRHPNFNRWEDTTLCRSWGNSSCDPLLGNNQRGTAFWKKVHELYYCVAHSLPDISLKENPNTRRTMDQLQNRFKGIQAAIQIFNVQYRHIVAESPPSGVPEDEYIDLACDRYKLVQGSKFRFKYLVPTLHAIVKFSPENETALQENHQLVDQNSFPINGEGGVIMVDSQGTREDVVLVTPLNAGRTNMAGSVMVSHLRLPIGTKRANAAATAARLPAARARILGEPLGEPLPEPPPFIPVLTVSPDNAARRQRKALLKDPQLEEEEDEEEEASSVNLLEAEEPAGAPQESHPKEDDCSESSGSETILPPPPKPVFPAILPLYYTTSKNHPSTGILDGVSMNKKKNKKKRGPTGPPAGTTVVEGGNKTSTKSGLVAAAGRHPRALPSEGRLPVEEFGTIDVNTQALIDFNTQALMEIPSKHTYAGSRLPPAGNLRRSSSGQEPRL
jgi:hypothetical protein